VGTRPNRKILSSFLDHLEAEHSNSPSTRNQRLSCIRAFFCFAADNNMDAIPAYEEILKVDYAQVSEKLVEHMSEDAVKVILAQPDTSKIKGLRDMFLMLFLYKTGARIEEALNVQLRHITFGDSPSVILIGKPNDKQRAVPLRDNTAEHLKKYLQVFHPNENLYSQKHLFYTTYRCQQKRMSEDNARDFIGKYGILARKICPEVPENVHPHLFRHSFGMSLYRAGIHLALISEWLGHSQFETTLIYAHADTEIKRRAIEKAVPVDTPLAQHINPERYKIDDDEYLKQLCGLR